MVTADPFCLLRRGQRPLLITTTLYVHHKQVEPGEIRDLPNVSAHFTITVKPKTSNKTDHHIGNVSSCLWDCSTAHTWHSSTDWDAFKTPWRSSRVWWALLEKETHLPNGLKGWFLSIRGTILTCTKLHAKCLNELNAQNGGGGPKNKNCKNKSRHVFKLNTSRAL